MRAFTIGHSTHPLDTFIALLADHGVTRLADVRRTPQSGHNPQFNRDALAGELPRPGIDYRHLPALGGRRRPAPDSPNGGWEHPAFRGYADYALTAEFTAGLTDLCALAVERPTAVMCAEAPWWRCHRRLIADRLTALGWTVCHIGPDGSLTEHELPPFAVATETGAVLYPPAQGSLPGL
jgi:uncharacterized protein (DUF488 family)